MHRRAVGSRLHFAADDAVLGCLITTCVDSLTACESPVWTLLIDSALIIPSGEYVCSTMRRSSRKHSAFLLSFPFVGRALCAQCTSSWLYTGNCNLCNMLIYQPTCTSNQWCPMKCTGLTKQRLLYNFNAIYLALKSIFWAININ